MEKAQKQCTLYVIEMFNTNECGGNIASGLIVDPFELQAMYRTCYSRAGCAISMHARVPTAHYSCSVDHSQVLERTTRPRAQVIGPDWRVSVQFPIRELLKHAIGGCGINASRCDVKTICSDQTLAL